MTRTERLLELMQRLRRSRQPLQAHTLAEQLDISVRTLYRDIETLRRQGADIEGEAGVGYVLRKGGPTLPPLMFRESEIEALVLGLRWVGHHADPALTDDARSALSKIGAILPPRPRRNLYAHNVPLCRAGVATLLACTGTIKAAPPRDRTQTRRP